MGGFVIGTIAVYESKQKSYNQMEMEMCKELDNTGYKVEMRTNSYREKVCFIYLEDGRIKEYDLIKESLLAIPKKR